ncbi:MULTISPECIES: glucose-1-phosphate adenylyltransferase subunit GlgD [Oceanobacillus]|uniref:Glycogen biosynthesis protein GlgD n=2 Tax=Oceanobacillus TaxID=182709 RepID=A0A0A1MQM9_9BACI|nr:glucose-1-phosphate adenylyltransferase subunit GlgD [Oceanobacillus oncorhynchi]MDM8100050.1 glucose-1-phosphate adenylyltransferase subunit GlgD [Oceanobacillus oncorhynchi]UUI40597.1 glucose-1-phosphate adenylyltransferase subunit GlgD [Oceanobacillus oncorhynchi]CEI82039.1 Glycogen biosynthesis protein GlgD [Oceanobacillus oncorhynchi]
MRANKICAVLGNIQRYNALLPLTNERPLATLPFACKYRLIDFPLSSIVNANINTVYMIFNEGETQSVFDHIGGGKEWNLDGVHNRFFIHLYQDFLKLKAHNQSYYRPLIDYLEKSKSEYTVYMSSKMICNIDLRAVLKIHQQQNNEMTVVYKKVESEKICQTDAVLSLTDNGQITEVRPYMEHLQTSEQENLCMDIYIVQTDWLIRELKEGQQEGTPADIQDFLRKKIHTVKSSTYEHTGYLSNIFDINSYYNASLDMLNQQKFSSLLYSNQKIYTKLKNEVPTYYSESSEVNNSQFATGCIIEGKVEGSSISRGTVIDKGTEIIDSIIMPSAKICAGARVQNAILDKEVVVDPGVQIIGTRENPVVIEKYQHVTNDILANGVAVGDIER